MSLYSPDGVAFKRRVPSEERRRSMVEKQLLPRGIHDRRVIEAMLAVPREEFVPDAYRDVAYADGALPIGAAQTISQPYTVALMAQELRLRGDEKVLEVGTGSGYGAAVLSRLARRVFTIERIRELAVTARARLLRLGYENVQVLEGDGSLGWPEEAPFDGVSVTAAAPAVPPSYFSQLADGGRLVIPVGGQEAQNLCVFTRRGDRVECDDLGAFVFVPLVRSGPASPGIDGRGRRGPDSAEKPTALRERFDAFPRCEDERVARRGSDT